jgi:hypothetical protein
MTEAAKRKGESKRNMTLDTGSTEWQIKRRIYRILQNLGNVTA